MIEAGRGAGAGSMVTARGTIAAGVGATEGTVGGSRGADGTLTSCARKPASMSS